MSVADNRFLLGSKTEEQKRQEKAIADDRFAVEKLTYLVGQLKERDGLCRPIAEVLNVIVWCFGAGQYGGAGLMMIVHSARAAFSAMKNLLELEAKMRSPIAPPSDEARAVVEATKERG